MIFKEVEYEDPGYLFTAVLDNGVTIHAFADGTADGDDGKRYRAVSHIDPFEIYDVFDETIVDGWELIEE